MSDRWIVALAVAVCLGAWWAAPMPVGVGVVGTAAALATRRPTVLCGAALVLAAGLSARAWAGTAPLPAGPVAGVVTLLDDPRPAAGGAARVTVRVDGHRLDGWARGAAGRALTDRLAGERVALSGTVTAVPRSQRRRLAEQHIAGQLNIDVVGDTFAGNPASVAANRVRRLLTTGAASMPAAERALFTGFVLGDDRAEPAVVVDEFRASGLSHLTAVSGENVAFLLAVAGPLLRRLPLGVRVASTVALVAWFALLTRFEPSVLRACAMAALAATAYFLARPASTIRLLGLAVAGLVLVDPLLVWSVGWWLSVGATVGIAVLGVPLAARLPGPRSLAGALSVTLAAQIGVAPVSLAVFGGLPVVSVAANLLAVPVAGPVMVWGLPAGVAAGLLPAPVATVLHVPTRLGVRWIALVARLGAAVPVGQVRPVHVPFLLVVAAVGWAVARRHRPRSCTPERPEGR